MSGDALRDLTDYERDILANVRDHGCHITSVSDEPPFTYSAGFIETASQPEVIIFGLPSKLCASMINNLLRMCREGLELTDGGEIEGLLQAHRVIARAIDPDNIVRDHFNSAIWYEQRRTGRTLDRAMQLVWPGALDGLFPWDDGCSKEVRDLQPALYERSMLS